MAVPSTAGVMSRLLARLQKTSGTLFGRYLLVTNVSISAGLSATGDILQQHYEMLTNKPKEGQPQLWDTRRTSHMSVSGVTVGVLCHYWYQWLDRRMPGRTLRTVIKKVVVDQIVLSPVAISVFFGTVGLLEGKRAYEIGREIAEKGYRLYFAEWFVWPAAQVVNFYVLPTRYRVLYDNTISLGFDVYTSYVKHGTKPAESNKSVQPALEQSSVPMSLESPLRVNEN